MTSVNRPVVSVIVPVYKVERYIRNCLDSLKNQTFRNWEAILVDDGSPDRSGEICEEYAASDARIRVFHKENGGLSSARNFALQYANGEYAFFLDSDDFLQTDAIYYLYYLAKETNAGIVQCDFVRGNANRFPKITKEVKVNKYDNHTVFTRFAAKIITCGKLYRRDVIGEIRFPEGLINEDDFTTWKFYYNSPITVVSSNPLYYYTINANSIMAKQAKHPNLYYFNAYRERISFFKIRNEQDLEAVSRIQWMKSLVMLYANPQLSSQEKLEIKSLFKENYNSVSLKTVKLPLKLQLVFLTFPVMPMLTSKLVKRLYKAGV